METFKNFIVAIFNPTPPPSIYTHIFYIISALLLIGAIILKIAIIKKKKEDKAFKKQFKKYPAHLLFFAFSLVLYTFSRSYNVPFFSMRAVLYILMGGMIWLLYSLVKTFTHDYPTDKKRRLQQMGK